ncbi:unnamed protein product [Durusdinium trenchii]|uniref:JmjC domain-containing protein n=1 Tax=Durusdinium trenchii TaxID=1381693 RepID=A0ABP0M5R4_9DINO
MAEPDLDALFGEDNAEECSAPKVHPALLAAVKSLAAEAWPVARSELLGESDAAAVKVRLPLAPALARDVDLALEAMNAQDWSDCASKAAAIRKEAWNALMRDKGWQRPCDKELFMLVELILALCAHASGSPATAVQHADGAFVFAAAGAFRSCALLFIRLLDDDARRAYQAKENAVCGSFPDTPPLDASLSRSDSKKRLERRPSPSPCELVELLKLRRPFLFSHPDWPAAARWKSLAYLDGNVGHRLIPAELGAEVGAASWREELIPFHRFLKEYLAPSCFEQTSSTAYLAQHELFEQCPVLRADIPVPSSWQEVLGPPTRCNAWIGTHSTLTPCHWDSYDNFLAQVQGFKRVALLAPEQASRLYVKAATGTSAQGNISPVNVEDPDLAKYPEFAQAEVHLVDLSPGDVLFMPSGWWHQVRALSPSISVT